MDIESISGLTTKSRGILYRLKVNLAKERITLKDLVCRIFEYHKGKYTLKEFHILIQQYDPHLMLDDIDQLFRSIDEDNNDVIFFEKLEAVLKSITEQDNPSMELNRKSKIVDNTEKQKFDVIIEFKDKLLQVDDYLQAVCLFVTEKDGFLTKNNLNEIFNNFQFNGQNKRNTVADFVFGNKNKVEVNYFLLKLGLDTGGMRVNMKKTSPYKKQNYQIDEEMKSQYIKIQQKSKMSNKSYGKNMEPMQNSLTYSIQNIPSALQGYFNYGSELQEPFASLASHYIQKNLLYLDQANPTYQNARRWVHISQVYPNYQLFQIAQSIIKRDNTRKGLGAMLEPKDIIQGGFGDCYFLSAVAAIVQDYPELVYRLFVLEKNPSHIFGVKLFIDGAWNTIPLDGCFPMNGHGAFCGAQPHHQEIWVMLLEKAWAKVFKTYENIHSGYNEEGLLAISGAPSVQVSSQDKSFLRKVMAQFGKGAIITCATSRDVTQLTEKQQEHLGVFAGHAYTLLKIYENLPYRNSQITLLKIRNPWGKKGWKGDWSFNSPTWTKQLRQKVGYQVDPSDGTFFVSLADFVIYFDHINISKVNVAYRNSHVVNHTSRFNFYQNRFIIKQKGDYYFTLYQQNGRKFKNMSTVYQKSKSWLFLARIINKNSFNQIQTLNSIACVCSFNQNSTIQTTLQPGEYVLISKVSWRHWNQHHYTLTSYGPAKILFTPGVIAHPAILQKFVTSRAEEIAIHDGGKVDVYQGRNASKRYDFSITDGIGFISVTNFENGILEIKITMEQSKGLTVLHPYALPLQMSVMPYETKTAGFIVDPEGFRYSTKEKYSLKSMY